MELKVDSAAVHAWIGSIVTGDRRIRTKCLGEALVRRWLSILSDFINEYDIRLSVTLVPSHCNKAEVLTRVPQQWLRKAECFAALTNAVTREETRQAISLHSTNSQAASLRSRPNAILCSATPSWPNCSTQWCEESCQILSSMPQSWSYPRDCAAWTPT